LEHIARDLIRKYAISLTLCMLSGLDFKFGYMPRSNFEQLLSPQNGLFEEVGDDD
jgi:hypothetical protein